MSFLIPQQDSGGGDGGAAAAAAQAEADKKAAELKAQKDRELAYGQDSAKKKTLASDSTSTTTGTGNPTGATDSLSGGSMPLVSYTLLNNKLG